MAQATTVDPLVFETTENQEKSVKTVYVPDTRMTVKDRCDSTFRPSALKESESCRVRAYVRVVFNTGQLVFCSHHYEQHKDDFENVIRVDDYREKEVHNRLVGSHN